MFKLKIQSYLALSKIKVISLVILSGIATFFIEGSWRYNPFHFIIISVGLFFVAAASNTLNQIFEVDIDSKMERTRYKRPLVSKSLSLKEAWIFFIFSTLIGLSIFLFFYNKLSFFISLFTLIFYGFFYTLILKPNTYYNIVIGGIAGSASPIIVWASFRNHLFDFEPWIIFFLIFFWTPPHFWALSLYCKEDYKKVNYPMLPLVKGNKNTLNQIFIYSIIVFFTSISLIFFQRVFIYFFTALILGTIFVYKSYELKKNPSSKKEYQFFLYSIFYMYIILFALILDGLFIFGVK